MTPADDAAPRRAWRRAPGDPSLPEVFSSVRVPRGGPGWRRLLAFVGPGYLVAVGYMDPGNWATDLAGGSRFGFDLLSVILASSLLAILLQALAAKLGVATGRDLAQACRDHFSRPVGIALWVLCEVAIVACDLAEVIGSAIALQLLFHLPLLIGVLLTGADVLVILFLQSKGFRWLEAFVVALLVVIAGAFAVEIALARPNVAALAAGFLPKAGTVTDPARLYVAIGILGATVMPHNLYLHSSIVQTRDYPRTEAGKQEAVRFATIDSTVALTLALFVNAAILILAAAVFHRAGHAEVAEIGDAHRLLAPLLGSSAASVLFAVALLASGQNSTVTATLAGQVVMEGFLSLRLKPWVRRMLTRGVAIVPAAVVAASWGEGGMGKLLVLSQVVLSLQLPFAVIPLVLFTGDRAKMGALRNGPWLQALAWAAAAVITALNLKLLLDVATGR
jgi:manganese transport protein